jgi:hypothetical protein
MTPDNKPANAKSPGVKLSNDVEVTSSSPDDHRLSQNWGFITAYPHEYLIHFRAGKLNTRGSGQGARCFKWANDTVFIIPTSLKEIIFQANQLSSDNVDVRIRGLAIYRIKDPMRIYTMLNFSNRQQAEEKLARMIGDLCRSTAKWLVANMKVEECLRKRKEDIGEALKKEVSLVASDPDKGWGVEIITVDIQDVYIQDAEIFSAMQTLFKTEKLRESQLSQLELQKDLEVKTLQQERELAEYRKNNELEKARIEAELKTERIRLAQESDEKQFILDRTRAEQIEAMNKFKLEHELERERQRIQLRSEESQAELQAKRLEHDLEIDNMRRKMEVENSATPLSLEKNFIENALPTIADAVSKNMGNARINIMQSDGNAGTPFQFVLTELVNILKERIESLPSSAPPDQNNSN